MNEKNFFIAKKKKDSERRRRNFFEILKFFDCKSFFSSVCIKWHKYNSLVSHFALFIFTLKLVFTSTSFKRATSKLSTGKYVKHTSSSKAKTHRIISRIHFILYFMEIDLSHLDMNIVALRSGWIARIEETFTMNSFI